MAIILPQVVATGIYNSGVVIKDKTVTSNRKTTMFEIELPMEQGGISYIDSLQMPISPDMLICAKPGQTRHSKLPHKCYYIHMIVPEGILYDTLMNLPVFIKAESPKVYLRLFEDICACSESMLQEDSILLQARILELIHKLTEDAKKQEYFGKMKNSNKKIIESVIKYIDENITEDLSLEKLSAYANLSPIHFHNCFKASTGKTLHRYVEDQRIKKASVLLVSTDMTLTHVSNECGFSSQSYFSYAFKRSTGLTPREYVKKIYGRYTEE